MRRSGGGGALRTAAVAEPVDSSSSSTAAAAAAAAASASECINGEGELPESSAHVAGSSGGEEGAGDCPYTAGRCTSNAVDPSA
jgi:hypothetical protein